MSVVSLPRISVELAIPIALHRYEEPQFSLLTKLRVGPFGSEEEALAWELHFVAAAVIDFDFEDGTWHEARTARGRAVRRLTRRERVEVGVAVATGNPLTHIEIGEAELIKRTRKSLEQSPPDVDVSATEVDEVARDLKYFIRATMKRALETLET